MNFTYIWLNELIMFQFASFLYIQPGWHLLHHYASFTDNYFLLLSFHLAIIPRQKNLSLNLNSWKWKNIKLNYCCQAEQVITEKNYIHLEIIFPLKLTTFILVYKLLKVNFIFTYFVQLSSWSSAFKRTECSQKQNDF